MMHEALKVTKRPTLVIFASLEFHKMNTINPVR